ncbi:MAG TPA: beta-glucosidase BglX [Terracidiphilus sp.]|nr:beta-glucosidase BglX [Terracidiphilus sp.]
MKTAFRRQTVALLGSLLFAGPLSSLSSAQARPVPNAQLASKEVNARVESLLKKMTLEEKIGQLVQYSAGFATGPAQSNVTYDDLVAKGQVGSMLNVVGADKTDHYQHIAMEKSRLHIPIIFGLDVIHGDHTTFPIPLAIAASWDPAAAETVARTGAIEARADGIDWVFSPMVDIARDPRWGRIVESNGEDPYLSSAMARAWVKGYQQDDITKPDSVVASVKHFAAYGAAIAGRDYNATDMSEQTLRQIYLPPYHAAVDAGVATVMSSFNSINGVPATANPLTLTQILRKEWGFDGFVVSDWGAVGELKNHSIGDGPTVARKALEAGLDMDMEGNLFGTTLASQVRSGKISESVVDEAVRRILRVKFAMGLFDHPYTNPSPAYEATPERRAVARKVADETMVLLKNDPVEGVGALLPLTSKAKKVALIGPLADDARDLLGAWSAGDPKNVITLKQELSQRLGDRLIYSVGCNPLAGEDEKILESVVFGGSIAGSQNQATLDDDKSIADAVEAAKQSDVAILALGEPANWMEGEAASRVHLGFTGNQEKLLEAIVATGKPVVLVVLSGRPLELKWAAEHVPAILQAWSPGIEAGPAVADVLFGDVNPSGKLPSSFPRAVGQEPLYYAQLPTGRPAGHVDLTHMPSNSQEKFVSRYVDEQNSALFPFGWGLSYTRFHYSTPTLSKDEIPLQEVLTNHTPVTTVGIDVTNTGSVAGTEVVQLYIRNTEASVEQPVRELKGFARVELAPGETKHLTFPLGFDELSFYNAEVHRTVEATTYNIWVGGSSLADQQTEFKIVE